MKKLLVLFLFIIVCFSAERRSKYSNEYLEQFEVQIIETTAKNIRGCVLGQPTNQFVRLCVNRKRIALRWDGYEWVVERLFRDMDSKQAQCSCESFDAKGRKQNERYVKQKQVTYRKIEIADENSIKVKDPTTARQIYKLKQGDTPIVCVKCEY